MTKRDPLDHPTEGGDLGHEELPTNREPGTRKYPHASRPRRDLEDRAAVDGQDDEGREHLYGHRTLDGQASPPHYLGNRARGPQARHVYDSSTQDPDQLAEPPDSTGQRARGIRDAITEPRSKRPPE